MEVQEEEETVDKDKSVDEMSPEELQHAYDNALEGETDESAPEGTESEEVADGEVEAKNPETIDESQNDTAEEEVETEKDPVAELTKQMEGIQKLIAKFGNEVGEIRKFKESLQSGETNNESDDDDIDPYVDFDAAVEKKLQEREKSQMAEQEKIEAKKQFVKGRVPKFEEMMDVMTDELKSALKDDPDVDLYTENFKANPYVIDPLTLMFMGKTAELRQEIQELQAKVSNTANSKGDLIKKVNSLGRNKGIVGSGSNGNVGSKKADFTSRQIESTQLDDLMKLYEQSLETNQ